MADYRYRLNGRLILVPVVLHGRYGHVKSHFILDTGASHTMVDPTLTDSLGYSAREASGFSTVASVLGKERGYRLIITRFETLGQGTQDFEIVCHNLHEQGVEGLIGMDFLTRFDWCLHPARQMIAMAG